MDFVLIILILGALFIFIMFGAVFGIDSHRKVIELRKRVEQLESTLAYLRKDDPHINKALEASARRTGSTHISYTKKANPVQTSTSSSPLQESKTNQTPPPAQTYALASEKAESGLGNDLSKQSDSRSWFGAISELFTSFPTNSRSTNVLFWLGGIILAFGGLFLAKYTLDAGLLSPVARVLLGFGVGIGFVVSAEYLTQRKVRFRIHSDYLCAALVSAGVITCYAMTLVASHYYELISPNFAFVILAIIALTATAMTLRYGPIVAVIGILGAYSVPLPFWQFSYSVLAIAGYVALVSVSAIVVANQVQRNWLWWLSFAAHFSWFFIMVMIGGKGEALSVFLFSMLSLYLYVLSDVLGWRLQHTHLRPLTIRVLLMPRKEQAGLLASLLPIWLFYFVHGYQPSLILATVAVLIVLCSAPLRHSAFDSWPLLGWLLSIITLIMLLPQAYYEDLDFVFTGAHLYSQAIALALFIYALYMQRLHPKRLAYSLLLVVAPSSLFGLCYVLSPPPANIAMYSLWAVELAVLAVIGVRLTTNHRWAWVKLSGVLLANVNVSLIITMLLESSTLTLALGAQLVGLGYWCQRYSLKPPHWLVKTLLAVLLIRLTLFPWIDNYSGELLLGIHWTVVVYPVTIFMLYMARNYYRDDAMRQVLGGGIIHVLALLVTTETSYQLVGHYPDFTSPSFHEAILLSMNWLIMAGVYCYRYLYSSSLRYIYLGFAGLLTVGAGIYHLALLTFSNPWFSQQPVGELPIWNWLLPLWLIPALVLLAVSRLSLFNKVQRLAIYGVAALWLLQFINATVRHQFHHDMIWLGLPTQQLETYAYSLVWLLISVVLLLGARRFNSPVISKVGFGVLAAVVSKAFLVDMSQLTGLYRALSFLGLGLCLLGIGWLFQRMKDSAETNDSDVIQEK